ncbi:sugar kinase [Pleomorphovibrio marinus]|uniref:sugar kinase n=1 Tax=Pleomorphovibrio marinus TaxID=2164132 RepID=UPI000E0CBC67|nr:sugar kinase [Pleomorphovibrio marinus]
MSKRIITLGEVMMRLSTTGHERFFQTRDYEVQYGGAEANVAVSLAFWGQSVAHICAFPDNEIGKAANAYLRSTGIDTTFIQKRPGRMGLYFFEGGAMQRASKIIYDRAYSAFSEFDGEGVDWDRVFEGADWFHWTGITPAISDAAAKLTIKALEAAQKHGVKVSGDINYRRNLWQYGKGPLEVMPELIQHTQVIIAGLTDMQNCMDIHEEDYVTACQNAKAKFPSITHIVTTERQSMSSSHNVLSGMLWNGKQLLHSRSYDMPNIVDRVGGGDAFMAGLIYGLLNNSDHEALEFAVAASVLKHSIPGDVNYVSLEEVEDLVKGENVGKLLR